MEAKAVALGMYNIVKGIKKKLKIYASNQIACL